MSILFVAFLFAVGICPGLQALHTAHTHKHTNTHTYCTHGANLQNGSNSVYEQNFANETLNLNYFASL
jgi:hypothetical protein